LCLVLNRPPWLTHRFLVSSATYQHIDNDSTKL